MSLRLRDGDRLEVSPVTGTIGAELSGVDLAQELSDQTVADIRAALLANRVVFFRDQALDYERQVAFAQRLGTLTLGHPTIQSPPDQPLMEEVDSAKGAPAADWHTDVTFLDQPVSFTCLRGVVIPPVGGDTVWANTVNAYATLTPELRALADSLRVIHTNAPGDVRIDGGRSNPAWIESGKQFMSTIYRAEHSAVTVHPETGERALLLGGFAHRLVGYPSDLSRAIIRTFQDYVTRPENTVRWHWRARRRRDLGQPLDATLRGGRLRRRAPPVRARDGCRLDADRCRRPAERRVEGRRLHLLRRKGLDPARSQGCGPGLFSGPELPMYRHDHSRSDARNPGVRRDPVPDGSGGPRGRDCADLARDRAASPDVRGVWGDDARSLLLPAAGEHIDLERSTSTPTQNAS